ncbi:phenoloxidase-activating factor 2-like [Anopheles darlingi]|uniref:phenoloxidase-activating factor 2-like n=1 Tax=Anopheles darlingi TaxID=43151 RepID=UPI00210022AA|nr:phenoloxidase-activating factor 2-like [Anopheles darlingi]
MANRWLNSRYGLFYGTLVLLATLEMAKSEHYKVDNVPTSGNSTFTEHVKRYRERRSLTEPSETTSIPPYDERECGHRNINGIIPDNVRNEHGEAEFGEFPWMAAIYRRTTDLKLEYLCGGTLIEVGAVLTTASCIQRHRGQKHLLEVRLGEWDMSHEDEPIPSIDVGVQAIHIHREYATNKVNDIAIIILSDTIELTHTVGVACLPDASVDSYDFVAAGWGEVPKHIDPTELSQTVLKKDNLPVIDHKTCEQKLRSLQSPRYSLHNGRICAACSLPESSSFRNDAGSPYMVSIPGTEERYYVVGLSSSGYACSRSDMPTVLTKVSYHRTWIDDVVRQAGFSPLVYTYHLQEEE